MDEIKLTEAEIRQRVIAFLLQKPNGNWHESKVDEKNTHEHGVDIKVIGGSRNSEYFYIECKGKSYAKSANSVNKEGWLVALGQLITRMETKRVIASGAKKGEPNRAYKYGLGLYWAGARVALYRIPREIAKTLNLYVFSVYEDGWVKQWSPRDFGKRYTEEDFKNTEADGET